MLNVAKTAAYDRNHPEERCSYSDIVALAEKVGKFIEEALPLWGFSPWMIERSLVMSTAVTPHGTYAVEYRIPAWWIENTRGGRMQELPFGMCVLTGEDGETHISRLASLKKTAGSLVA